MRKELKAHNCVDKLKQNIKDLKSDMSSLKYVEADVDENANWIV